MMNMHWFKKVFAAHLPSHEAVEGVRWSPKSLDQEFGLGIFGFVLSQWHAGDLNALRHKASVDFVRSNYIGRICHNLAP